MVEFERVLLERAEIGAQLRHLPNRFIRDGDGVGGSCCCCHINQGQVRTRDAGVAQIGGADVAQAGAHRLTGVGADLELQVACRNCRNRQLHRRACAVVAQCAFREQDGVARVIGHAQPAVGGGTSPGEGGDDAGDDAIDQSRSDNGDSGIAPLDQRGRTRACQQGGAIRFR